MISYDLDLLSGQALALFGLAIVAFIIIIIIFSTQRITKNFFFQALALFGLAMVGALDKDRVSRLLSVHLAVMLSVWYYTIHP